MDYKIVGKMHKNLENIGFKMQKDVLGTYYSRTTHRFSIMKHAHMFICYQNLNSNSQWILIEKSVVFQNYQQALMWVHERATKVV